MFAVVQVSYVLYFFRRILSLNPGDPLAVDRCEPVSIIICAKNEAANLSKNLPSILAQRYGNDPYGYRETPLFEVIVVNDASEDDTAQVLTDIGAYCNNLRHIRIPKDSERLLPGKKFALSQGVAAAKHNWLVLIDADCVPASDTWLEKMVAPLAEGKEIVAGYGGYSAGSGVLNLLTRCETVHAFMQYSTYAMAGKPYMAVGRNMACTKEVLLRAQQSEIWSALPSGDDDLLVRIAGNTCNTAVVCDKQAFTYTSSKESWVEWINQKQRHLSTGKYYKREIKWLLGAYAVSHAGVWLCFIALLFSPYQLPALFVMWVRSSLYWGVWTRTATKLGEEKLISWFPYFDIVWMVYNFVFLPYITWKDKRTWT